MGKDREHKYTDNVLIRLKRKYSKDDTVAMLVQKLSETEILLGQRNDEIDELKEIIEFSKLPIPTIGQCKTDVDYQLFRQEKELRQLRGNEKTFRLNIETMKEKIKSQNDLINKYHHYTGVDNENIIKLYDEKIKKEINDNLKMYKK